MRRQSAQVALAFVCFLLGIMLVVQFRTQSRIVTDIVRLPANQQWEYASSLAESNQKLRKEVDDLRQQLLEYESSVGKSDLDKMVSDMNNLRVVNGASEVSGPGIEVTISGTLRANGGFSPEELNDLVNELRNAGAEAIAVNRHRVTIRSSFGRGGGGVTLNGADPITPPYVVEAIGQADLLEPALMRQGGLLYSFQGMYPEAKITVFRKTNLVLPQRDQDLALKLAKVGE
ncbi:MAG: DUF881 domain-containing protein [Chloroflexota bacterium]